MNRELYENDPIDLGAVTDETKGGPFGFEDEDGTLRVKLGLTDD